MSKTKDKHAKERRGARAETPAQPGRRKFLALGLGGLGTIAIAGIAGYKYSRLDSATSHSAALPNLATGRPLPPVTLPADYRNALRAAEEIVSHYARELNNPSALIHGVRAFGKNFTLNDGSKTVDFLCSKFAVEKELNGKRYIYFPREAEVHDNSFLKTLLEAGVAPDQSITAGGHQYRLRDLGESAQALFRCDPQNLQRFDPSLVYQHLPWGLIAFSILVPPSRPEWVNAYGETVKLPEVIDQGLAAFENSCAGVREAISEGHEEPLPFREEMAKYSCSGMHMAYGFFSCLKHGYRDHRLPERLQSIFDSLILRLQGDDEAIERESEAARQLGQEYVNRMGIGQDGKNRANGSPPPQTIEVMRLRHLVRALGHALEAINYARLHQLFNLTPEQTQRLQTGEQLIYRCMVQLRAMDLDVYLKWYGKFISDLVIAVAHAVRAMKLLTPNNPDTIAVNQSLGSRS